MHDERKIVRDCQRAVRRLLDRRGIPMKVVAADSGIKYDTLLTYFPADPDREPVELPLSAMRCLHKALKPEELNLLEPDGFAIVRLPAGIDFEEINDACLAFCAKKAAAHHPDSECGPAIGPQESRDLGTNVLVLRGKVA